MVHLCRYATLVVLALAPTLLWAAPKKPDSLGKIRALKGRVIISRNVGSGRKEIVAKKNMKVFENDEFTSGKASKAILRLNGGHIVQLGPSSFYRLKLHHYDKKKKVTKSLTKLLYGRMRANVRSPKKGKGNSFEVMTPNAVMGVRGTEFIASFDARTNTSNLITKKGKVSFRSARFSPQSGKLVQTSKPTVVKSGQQSTVIGSGQHSKLPTLESASRADDLVVDRAEKAFDEEVSELQEKYNELAEEEEEDAVPMDTIVEAGLGTAILYTNRLLRTPSNSFYRQGLHTVSATMFRKNEETFLSLGLKIALGDYAMNGHLHHFFVSAGIQFRLHLPFRLYANFVPSFDFFIRRGSFWPGFSGLLGGGWDFPLTKLLKVGAQTGLILTTHHNSKDIFGSLAPSRERTYLEGVGVYLLGYVGFKL